MLPDLDSLALFVKAAEFRSLTRASEACHIGLAAASRRITLLEHRVKCVLFERSPKGVELTPAGVTLLVHVKILLIQLNQMQADMDDHAVGRKGQLRVLANTSAMTQFVPLDLEHFSRTNPNVVLKVEERWSAQIISAVLGGEADLGVVLEGHSTQGLEVFEYRTDHVAVVVPNGHPLLLLDTVNFSDVLDYDLVGLESGSSLMRLLTERAVDLGKGLRLRVQVRGFDVVCRMVQSGMGIGLLPFQAASLFSGGMGVNALALGDAWAERRMLICVKKDRPPNVSLDRLLVALTTMA